MQDSVECTLISIVPRGPEFGADVLGKSGLDPDKTFQQLLTNLILANSQISSCLRFPGLYFLNSLS